MNPTADILAYMDAIDASLLDNDALDNLAQQVYWALEHGSSADARALLCAQLRIPRPATVKALRVAVEAIWKMSDGGGEIECAMADTAFAAVRSLLKGEQP